MASDAAQPSQAETVFARSYTPAHVAAAFFLNGTTLRGWHGPASGALATDADDAIALRPGGAKRRYSFADAVRIGIVEHLSSPDRAALGIRVSDAVRLANALRPHIDAAIADLLADSEAQPVALAALDSHPTPDWRVLVCRSARGLGEQLTSGMPMTGILLSLADHIRRAELALSRVGIADMSATDA